MELFMVRFGIQAPHEQINPTDLLNDVIMMERYGIEKCWSSDHYMPWWHTGATVGAAWPWLGAALAKTDRIAVGGGDANATAGDATTAGGGAVSTSTSEVRDHIEQACIALEIGDIE